MSNRFRVVLAVIMIVLAWAIWAGQELRTVRPPPQVQGEPVRVSDVVAAQAGPVASLIERVAVPGSDGWIFRVVDQQSGSGIPGAEVLLVEGALEAAYSKDELDKLGTTGPVGQFSSPSDGVNLDGMVLIVSSPTHLPRAVEVGLPGAYEVALDSAALIKVRVEDTSGDPVEGAVVMAYSGAADAGLVLGSSVSGYELSLFAPESVCVSAAVGNDGVGSLWLPQGNFSVCAQADGFFMLDPPKAVDARSGAGASTTVVLGELRGCVLALPPEVDGVLAHRARLRHGAWKNCRSLFANMAADSQKRVLESKFPRHVVVVMPCVNRPGTDGDSVVDLRLLINGVGWVSLREALYSLDEMHPRTMTIPNDVDSSLGPFRVNYTGSIPPEDIWRFVALNYSGGGQQVVLKPPLNTWLTLPLGTVSAADAIGVRLNLGIVDVGPDQSGVLNLDDRKLGGAVIIRTAIGGNRAPWGARITGRDEGRHDVVRFDLSPLDPGDFPALLPVGVYDVSVTWRGVERIKRGVVVAPGVQEWPLEWGN